MPNFFEAGEWVAGTFYLPICDTFVGIFMTVFNRLYLTISLGPIITTRRNASHQ